MTEYIEREALEIALNHRLSFLIAENSEYDHYTSGYEEAVDTVEDFPSAADVAPVVHSRWAHIGGDEWCCPACGFVITTEGSWDKPTKKYCENCGAKMDGGMPKDGAD